MIWRVFGNGKRDDTVEIVAVIRDTRTIMVRRMPNSQRALINAIVTYWQANEMPWSITEVLRYENPQHVFYSVQWIEGEDSE